MTSSNSPKPEKKIAKNTEISKTQKKKTKNAETPKTEKKKTKNAETPKTEKKKTKNAETPKTEKKKNAEIPKIEKKKTKSAEIPLTDGRTKRDREIAKEENKKKTKKPKLSNGTSKQRDEGSKKGVAEGKGEEGKMNVFPMNRIRTMIKGEDPDMRVSQEALLAINNAVEKFLEQFSQEAYAFCVRDRKKCLSYDHLAHVVSKQRRYDFLSDFVPERVKAEYALRERSAAGTGGH
uniref:Transcription factor CBF/NF-Y/archaeal histone domain-containing protein n=1 Tax=Glycine max TaxID=3847 RepID=C6T8U8_SOYBN|nr:unknown [Glycine max]